MKDHRAMLCGRASGELLPIPGVANTSILKLHVPGRGARINVWAALLGPAVRLPRPLANGDAVALIGEVSPDNRGESELLGPIAVEAVLVLDGNGDFFRNLDLDGDDR